MGGFASYNKFKTEIENTLSSEAAVGLGYTYGLTYSGLYPFSDASWMGGYNPAINQGNTPAERYQTIQCASFTSVKEYAGAQAGYASKFFYNISPNINNTQPPTGTWTNARNAIGMNFNGRNTLLTSLTPNNKVYFSPKADSTGLSPSGTISGLQGGGNTGGGNTGGGNTGGGNTGGGVGTGGNTGGIGVANNANVSVNYSDRRLKEKINRIGLSKTGIPVYEFNYKGSTDRYKGTMAQDLIKLGKLKAINKDNKGFYMVDYSQIDVEFTKI